MTARNADPELAAGIANAVGPALAGAADEFTTLLRDSGTEIEATTVTPATVPGTPTSPIPSRNIGLGAFAGLLVGIGIAFVRHTLDTKVRAEADIRPFSKEPMLGELPFDKAKTDLVTIDRDPHSGYAEAIRRLRTNLMFVDVTTGRHSFIVTSAMPGEGKTTTTVNLAMAMATTGGKVLLIDGDLRNPSVATHARASRAAAGLTTVLLGQAGGQRRDPAVARHQPARADRRGHPAKPQRAARLRADARALRQAGPRVRLHPDRQPAGRARSSTRCCSTG